MCHVSFSVLTHALAAMAENITRSRPTVQTLDKSYKTEKTLVFWGCIISSFLLSIVYLIKNSMNRVSVIDMQISAPFKVNQNTKYI